MFMKVKVRLTQWQYRGSLDFPVDNDEDEIDACWWKWTKLMKVKHIYESESETYKGSLDFPVDNDEDEFDACCWKWKWTKLMKVKNTDESESDTDPVAVQREFRFSGR